MQNNLQKALNRCYFFLKFRPRTEKEIKRFLFEKSAKYKLNKKTIDILLSKLKSQGYVNDKKFVDWFVLKRSTRKPKSSFLIKRELLNHGVTIKDIEDYFDKNLFDEYSLAKRLLDKHKFGWLNIEAEKRKIKAQNTLLRAGFSFDIIKRAVEEFEKNY